MFAVFLFGLRVPLITGRVSRTILVYWQSSTYFKGVGGVSGGSLKSRVWGDVPNRRAFSSSLNTIVMILILEIMSRVHKRPERPVAVGIPSG